MSGAHLDPHRIARCSTQGLDPGAHSSSRRAAVCGAQGTVAGILARSLTFTRGFG